MPDQLKTEVVFLKTFIKNKLMQLRSAKEQPKMHSSARGAAGTTRPPTVEQELKQVRYERKHASEKYALNLTGLAAAVGE